MKLKPTKKWHRNLVIIPSGSAGAAFVTNIAGAYADSSGLEPMVANESLPYPNNLHMPDIGLLYLSQKKGCTVAQILLLQKPYRTSKSKDHLNGIKVKSSYC